MVSPLAAVGTGLLERIPSLICAFVLIAVHFVRIRYDISAESLSLSYEEVVLNREYWRIITSGVTHGSHLHLIFNLLALAYLSAERAGGDTFHAIRLLTGAHYIAAWIAVYVWVGSPPAPSVGYSDTLFAILAVQKPFDPIRVLIVLLCISFIAPDSSFALHAAGVFVGYVCVLLRPVLDWLFTPYVYYNLLLWMTIQALASFARTRPTTAWTKLGIRIQETESNRQDGLESARETTPLLDAETIV